MRPRFPSSDTRLAVSFHSYAFSVDELLLASRLHAQALQVSAVTRSISPNQGMTTDDACLA